MSNHRFAAGSANSNQYATSTLVHHPWKTTASTTAAAPSSRKIDRFLTRSKRRKNPSWGSDASTIFTESTSELSSSSRSSTSPTPPLRKIEEPGLDERPHEDQDPDPRQTILSEGTKRLQPQQQYRPIDVDSLQEYRSPPLTPSRAERGVFQQDTNDDLQAPLPPRSPQTPFKSSEERRLDAPKPPDKSVNFDEPPTPTRIGPIDVDSLESYLGCSNKDDMSVDSLAMMGIEDPESGCFEIKPSGFCMEREATSGSLDSFTYTIGGTDPDDYLEEEDDGEPLDALMRLDKMDLLAESDSEDDLAQVRLHFKRFPVLDEREAERILCGYCRGFEPPMESGNDPLPAGAVPAAAPQGGAFEI